MRDHIYSSGASTSYEVGLCSPIHRHRTHGATFCEIPRMCARPRAVFSRNVFKGDYYRKYVAIMDFKIKNNK